MASAPIASVGALPARCPACGADNRTGYRYCRKCGHPNPSAAAAPPIPDRGGPGAPAPGGGPVVPVAPGPGAVRGPRRSSDLASFLRMNAYDRFDLLALNAADLAEFLRTAEVADRPRARQISEVAGALFERVRRETGRPEEVARLVREIAHEWFRGRTEGTASWRDGVADAWGGLFYESRDPGGRWKPRLADRLYWISKGRLEPEPGRRRSLLRRTAVAVDSITLEETPEDQLAVLRTAQALLDDLADAAAGEAGFLPLPRLTDLATSSSVHDVNTALQALLPVFDAANFLLVDPTRFPDARRVLLRWPHDRSGPGAPGYQLVVAGAPAGPGAAPQATLELDTAGWPERARTPAEWADLLTRLRDSRQRLPPPPAGSYRESLGYLSLRSAMLAGPPVPALFEEVRWRDRPKGPVLFNRLLLTGSFGSEIETDRDYLEAELSLLATGKADGGADVGVWRLDARRTVRRVTSADGTVSYTVGPPET